MIISAYDLGRAYGPALEMSIIEQIALQEILLNAQELALQRILLEEFNQRVSQNEQELASANDAEYQSMLAEMMDDFLQEITDVTRTTALKNCTPNVRTILR